jgi:Haem-NO-binding
MRGEILNEFVEFAAGRAGPGAPVALRASYDPAGRYDLAELVDLVDRVAAACGEPRGVLLASFGAHLFSYFAALYPSFVDDAGSALALLSPIETHIHGELRKLYPDADFPSLECTPIGTDGLEVVYRSPRPLADLAEGLIRGCIDHFGDPVRVVREDLPGPPGTAARFAIVPVR